MGGNAFKSTSKVGGIFTALAFVLIALFLASCRFAPTSPQNLEFNSSLFKADDVTKRAGKVGFGRLQFIIAQSGHDRAAIAFVNADDSSVVSDFYHHPRVFLRTWKELGGTNLKFGDEGSLETAIGKISYERFSYASNQCFLFHTVFDRSLSDDMTRERSVIGGYHCTDSGNQPETGQISDFLHGIRLSMQDSWNSIPRHDTSDLFAPQRPLFEIRVNPTGDHEIWYTN